MPETDGSFEVRVLVYNCACHDGFKLQLVRRGTEVSCEKNCTLLGTSPDNAGIKVQCVCVCARADSLVRKVTFGLTLTALPTNQSPWCYSSLSMELPLMRGLNSSGSESSIDSGFDSPLSREGMSPVNRVPVASLSEVIASTSSLAHMLVSFWVERLCVREDVHGSIQVHKRVCMGAWSV